jgi:hypothetical protein
VAKRRFSVLPPHSDAIFLSSTLRDPPSRARLAVLGAYLALGASNTIGEVNQVETKAPTRKRTPKNGEAKTTRRKHTTASVEISGEGTHAPVMAGRFLVQAPPDKAFWVNGGPVLTDLQQLRDALAGDISDEQFVHHVTGDKNDFAQWVEEVLGDTRCAQALRRARSRTEALRATEGPLPEQA